MLAVARDWNFFKAAGKPTAKSYVQDGLVAMWDGIENAGWGVHDPDATVWRDLSGNNHDFVLLSGGSFASNALVFNGLAAQSSISGYWTTIEICYIQTDGRIVLTPLYAISAVRQPIVSGGTVINGIGISTRESPSSLYQAANISRFNVDRTLSIIYSASSTSAVSAYENGTLVNIISVAQSPWSGPQGIKKTYIGGRSYNNAPSGDYPGYGKIHALRFYSRALTADEIAANHAVDKARFNLPNA